MQHFCFSLHFSWAELKDLRLFRYTKGCIENQPVSGVTTICLTQWGTCPVSMLAMQELGCFNDVQEMLF